MQMILAWLRQSDYTDEQLGDTAIANDEDGVSMPWSIKNDVSQRQTKGMDKYMYHMINNDLIHQTHV